MGFTPFVGKVVLFVQRPSHPCFFPIIDVLTDFDVFYLYDFFNYSELSNQAPFAQKSIAFFQVSSDDDANRLVTILEPLLGLIRNNQFSPIVIQSFEGIKTSERLEAMGCQLLNADLCKTVDILFLVDTALKKSGIRSVQFKNSHYRKLDEVFFEKMDQKDLMDPRLEKLGEVNEEFTVLGHADSNDDTEDWKSVSYFSDGSRLFVKLGENQLEVKPLDGPFEAFKSFWAPQWQPQTRSWLFRGNRPVTFEAFEELPLVIQKYLEECCRINLSRIGQVLLVDDMIMVRMMIRERLVSFGISDIQEATDVATALNFLRSSEAKPDLLICDSDLGFETAFDLLVQVRLMDKWRDIPIFVLVLKSEEKDNIAKYYQASGVSVLEKPFSRYQTIRQFRKLKR